MANGKRLIDANPIVQFIMDGLNNPDKMKALGHDAIEILAEIEYAPTVDAVEMVHGRWIELPGMEPDYKCSECGRSYAWWEPSEAHYCPNCGAKMDEEIRFVGLCERCEYRDECDWPKLHPKIELKKCPDFNEGEKNKNG